MNKVTKEQYEFALARVAELLPLVGDNTPANDKNAVELIGKKVQILYWDWLPWFNRPIYYWDD